MAIFLFRPFYWLCLGLALAGCQSPSGSAPLALTILHINDHHSHLEGHTLSYPVTDLSLTARTLNGATPQRVRLEYGGFARLATLFEDNRAGRSPVLSLHAGDALTGTPYFNEFRGEADAALMNRLCFDAFELGNHEFDNGDAGLAHFLKALDRGECATDILAANVRPGPESPLRSLPLKPYSLYEFDGHTVGVIGLDIALKTKQSSSPDPETRFLDETDTAQHMIDTLTGRGIDRIILLTHYQYENDRKLAGELTDVDVIVGGDSHTLLGNASLNSLGFAPEGPYPTKTRNRDGDLVCIVQAWDAARAMGRLTVLFDGKGRLSQCEGTPLLPVDPTITFEYTTDDWRPLPGPDAKTLRAALSSVPELRWTEPDPATLATLAPYRNVVDALRNDIAGRAQSTLCHARLPGAPDCDGGSRLTSGSEIATVVSQSFLRAVPGADIALQNAGGVRTHLDRGAVTRADIQRLLPFDNTLMTVTLTGAELRTLLEQGVAHALRPDGSTGGYPYAAGVRFEVDTAAPEGDRLSTIEVSAGLAEPWQPLEPEREYHLVVNSYTAGGGDGYHLLAEKTSRNTGIHYARPLTDWLQSLEADSARLTRPNNETFSTRRFQ